MLKYRYLLLFVLGTAFFVFYETHSVYAQSYYNFGSSPAISPWLGLSNRPTGVLDSYNQYVRPRMEIQREFQVQQDQLNRQGMRQEIMYRESQQAQRAATQRPGTSTGPRTSQGVPVVGRFKQAASFRNYSHYYPNKR